jgi:[acyl-carrier-protein] S-malonyltransferase
VLALLFPGQGSQEVGMAKDACEASDAARAVFEAADAALDLPLSRLCFEGPEDELVRTEIQQPAILTASIALLRMLEERVAVEPNCVAGHSLGEYTALVAAGALDFEDAVRLVHARGRFMQEAVPEGRGAMAAVIGCSAEEVERACAHAVAKTGRTVGPANFNGPNQTVISGDAVAVEVACTSALQEGAKRAIPLNVSAPFHCALMAPAAEKLALDLACVRFRDARMPVITNVEARPCSEAARFASLLEEQVTSPVRFTEMVGCIAERGVRRVLEIGPGRVLTGLAARIARGIERANLSSCATLDEVVTFVAESA